MDYNKIWNELNNDGEGFSIGSFTDDINDIPNLDGFTLIKKSENDNDVAVYHDGVGSMVIVGNSNGPWAVNVGTYTCACCGDEIVGRAEWINGDPFCTSCVEAGI